MALSKQQVLDWLLRCSEVFAREQVFLTQLDTAIGDGDHGLNMNRGFNKVAEKLPSVADGDIGSILKYTGMTLLSHVGGASGPLFGTFFIRAAQVANAKQSLELSELRLVFQEGVAGVVMRGRAEPGDKTLCDVWWPVLGSLGQSVQQQINVIPALQQAAACAEQAVQTTIVMQARKGRASYLGERSIGHQDPGATSVMLMMKTLAAVVEEAG
ncbi:dihydroxyacetone kinase [Chania multitudinisentens RB-25]|uniref:Dihydroxyacetone kinase n=1 Tax=Chania multitudinisentens RB-25 TaxID=1441930 RepID=W0LB22_9GAMM|nr:dihydroxyacetone kinase subunit DhaL [Chania multitudinisentens]AHG19599.1 dihydroxyacetone kinase [Chania multitudinisentens RB-25]